MDATHLDPDQPLRILITGASGFVGTRLGAACLERYPQATCFGLSHAAPGDSADDRSTKPIETIVANIRSAEAVRAALSHIRPHLIFHLAGQASVAESWRHPQETLATNAGGALNLFEALRLERLTSRVVVVGSGEQYGVVRPEDNPVRESTALQPMNPYAVSKTTQDLFAYQYFSSFALPLMRVRAFNHFGPGQADTFVIASFARQIALIEAGFHDPVLRVGNLEAQRDFLPVADVVRAYIAIADRGRPGAAYNVGSGEARSIADILARLLALAKTAIRVENDPARFRPTDVPLIVADISELRAHTGWEPSDAFDSALEATLDYWRERVARDQPKQ